MPSSTVKLAGVACPTCLSFAQLTPEFVSEKQRVLLNTLGQSQFGGSFRLSLGAVSSDPIGVDFSAPRIEDALWAGANNTALPFGIRRAYIDSYIGLAKSDDALAKLTTLLNADSVAGEPMKDPTRWSIVDRLTVVDYKDAPSLLATQILRDTTPDGRRRAFTAGAGRKNAQVKKDYFTRYFSDKSLNEDWASGSLGIFNSGDHAELTLPYLRPALDSLPYIQANRRIFFLGSWLGAFIGGHKSEAALKTVQQYLADNLPLRNPRC
jgi:aminopeptidase N